MVVAVVGMLGLVLPASPASAADQTTVTSPTGVTVTVTGAPTVQYFTKDCVSAPVTVTVTYPGGSGYTQANLYEAGPGEPPRIARFLDTHGQSGTYADRVQLCPDLNGIKPVNFYVEVDGAWAVVPLIITASPARTELSASARARASNVTVRGRVTTPGHLGMEGIQGTYTVEALVAKSAGGSGKWTTLGTYAPERNGTFVYQGAVQGKARGSKIRVSTKCDGDYCAAKSIVVTAK